MHAQTKKLPRGRPPTEAFAVDEFCQMTAKSLARAAERLQKHRRDCRERYRRTPAALRRDGTNAKLAIFCLKAGARNHGVRQKHTLKLDSNCLWTASVGQSVWRFRTRIHKLRSTDAHLGDGYDFDPNQPSRPARAALVKHGWPWQPPLNF